MWLISATDKKHKAMACIRLQEVLKEKVKFKCIPGIGLSEIISDL
jgi:hypothetical protein